MCCGMDCEGAPREPGIGVSGSGAGRIKAAGKDHLPGGKYGGGGSGLAG